MMPSPKKYEAGEPFETVFDVINHMLDGAYFWFRGKPFHPLVIKQWPLAMTMTAAAFGILRRAKFTQEYMKRNET